MKLVDDNAIAIYNAMKNSYQKQKDDAQDNILFSSYKKSYSYWLCWLLNIEHF